MLRDILLLNPVYISLFWALVLLLQRGSKNQPKRFLSLVMFSAFVVYLSHLVFFSKMDQLYLWFDPFYNMAQQSIYPLYFIYILLLTRDNRFSWKSHGKYLIVPLFVFVLVSVGYIIMDSNAEQVYVREVLRGNFTGGHGIIVMIIILHICTFLFIGQVVYYMIKSFDILKKYNKSLVNYYSAPELRDLGWVQLFNILLLVSSLITASSAALGRHAFEGNDMMLIFPSLFFSFILFAAGFMASIQQKVITEDLTPNNNSQVEEKVPEKLVEDLVALFVKDQCYLNKDLKIWDLTAKLGTNRTYVSRIINNEFGQNFCAFVNKYRVDHVKHLLDSSDSYTIEEIADMAGFGSVNSLYRAFASQEKISLSQYRKNIRSGKSG